MTFGEGLKTAFYFTVGAVAVGAEALAAAADVCVKRGNEVVAKGKETYHKVCDDAQSAENKNENSAQG